MVRTLRVLIVAVGLLVPALAARHDASASGLVGPKAVYLALGDSLAFGYQENLALHHGYVDDFYADLTTHGTRYLINMACGGESTTTFINGGCPYPIRKYPYRGSQLAAALAFLQTHQGQVSPVTIDIGANDVLPGLVDPSTCTLASPQTIAAIEHTFDANYISILQQLKQAIGTTPLTHQPQGDLITMTYYDPYQNQCATLNPQVFTFFHAFNAHIEADAAQVAAETGSPIPVVDVFAAFGGATTPNPHICIYTWMCSGHPDIHPTSLGYAVMARAFETTVGY